MGNLSGLFCCRCGTNTDCKWEDLNYNKMFQCPDCKETAVKLSGPWGGSFWFTLNKEEVEFSGLLDRKRMLGEEDESDLGC